MLYVFFGGDNFSLNQALEEIKKGVGDQAALTASTTTLDGQQLTLDQLRSACETVPFLSGKRLVIVKGLLERFEPRNQPPRQRMTQRTNSHPEQHKPFSTLMSQLPESTILMLVESRVASTNPLFRELADKAVVKSFPPLRDTQLRQWVQRKVTEEGGSISPRAVDLLTKLVGSNLWIMTGEVNKLLLFAPGRRVEEEDVKTVVSYTQQDTVFAVVDAIVEFKAELAQRMLEQLLKRGAAPAYLLVMLARQVRLIVRARELTIKGTPKTEIQHRLGLPSEFAFRKTLEQASRYSLPRLKEVYHQLLEADLSIKTGRYGGELALNILVAELCQRRQSYVTHSRTD